MLQQDAVSEQVRDMAVAPVECDVPIGWSLDDWRTVRGLAREVTTEPGKVRTILTKLRAACLPARP